MGGAFTRAWVMSGLGGVLNRGADMFMVIYAFTGKPFPSFRHRNQATPVFEATPSSISTPIEEGERLGLALKGCVRWLVGLRGCGRLEG